MLRRERGTLDEVEGALREDVPLLIAGVSSDHLPTMLFAHSLARNRHARGGLPIFLGM